MVKRFGLLKKAELLMDFYSRIFTVETGEGPMLILILKQNVGNYNNTADGS